MVHIIVSGKMPAYHRRTRVRLDPCDQPCFECLCARGASWAAFHGNAALMRAALARGAPLEARDCDFRFPAARLGDPGLAWEMMRCDLD
jgi:hypothetical protein